MSDEIPDLRSLLAEASRPSSHVTVPLKQGLRERIEAAEAELSDAAAKPTRMGAKSPLKAKAEEIEGLRAEMAASALTFHFETPDPDAREAVRQAMSGRDDPAEWNLRMTAAAIVKVVAADGTEYPGPLDWTDLQALRRDLGFTVYEATIDAESNKVYPVEWSVPFSSAASHILGTAK